MTRKWKICFLVKSRTPFAGSLFEFYRIMGSGFLEAVYQDRLERAFVRGSPGREPTIRSRRSASPMG
jgi:hypothetical protein